MSLAKLFMKPFMAHFNAFDNSFDASAALAVFCEALPFTVVKPFAEDVRSKVRNEWAHCNFAEWTEAHYNNCFHLMETLVTKLAFAAGDETRILGELQLWRKQGMVGLQQKCFLDCTLWFSLMRLVHGFVYILLTSQWKGLH